MNTQVKWLGLEITEEPISYTYSPQDGGSLTRTWAGTQQQIGLLELQLRQFGYSYTITGGPLWRCVSTTPGVNSDGNTQTEGDAPPTWQLVTNHREIDLLDSKCPFVSSLSPGTIQAIKKAADNGDVKPDFSSSLSGSTAIIPAAERAAALDVFNHYKAGAKSIPYNDPILSQTFTVNGAYQVNLPIVNCNKVLSNATMKMEGVPFALYNILPATYASSKYMPPPNATTLIKSGILFTYGWLKGWPQYQQSGRNKYQVSLEYQYGVWPFKIFGELV